MTSPFDPSDSTIHLCILESGTTTFEKWLEVEYVKNEVTLTTFFKSLHEVLDVCRQIMNRRIESNRTRIHLLRLQEEERIAQMSKEDDLMYQKQVDQYTKPTRTLSKRIIDFWENK